MPFYNRNWFSGKKNWASENGRGGGEGEGEGELEEEEEEEEANLVGSLHCLKWDKWVLLPKYF